MLFSKAIAAKVYNMEKLRIKNCVNQSERYKLAVCVWLCVFRGLGSLKGSGVHKSDDSQKKRVPQ